MRRWNGWFIPLVLVAVAAPAQAQRFGAQLNWGDHSDLGVGARLEFALGGLLPPEGALSSAYGIASFDYFFPDCGSGTANVDCSYWELNLNGAVPIVGTTVDPYVGAGLNIAHASFDAPEGSDTDLGLNALAGLRFPLGTLSAFAEARVELGGGKQLVLTFGALLGGSRR